MRHVLLIGATDGIGLELARHYLGHQWRVGVVGRSRDKLTVLERQLRSDYPKAFLRTVICDVTDVDRTQPAFEEALRELGQVDTFIYCAGVLNKETGPGGRVGETFEVNVVGAIRWLELASEYLAAAGRGTIAALGSVAGDRGRKGSPAYNASKAALHEYLEGLRHRLQGKGVKIFTVKPGWVNTRMLETDRAAAIEASAAARKIARGLEGWREVFYVPFWWRGVSLLLRLLPRPLFKRIAPP